jgi:DNA-binding CsgD family transcriptional regulator
MQARELERNQDPPRPVQDVRSQKEHLLGPVNTLSTQGQYVLGRRNDVQHNRHIDQFSVKRNYIPPVPASLAPSMMLQHIWSECGCSPPSRIQKIYDRNFFRKEVFFFLFDQRNILSTLCRKIMPISDFYINDRDIETIAYLAAGYGAKEIARELNLSPRTVEHRVEALKRRLGARNVTHLIAMVLLSNTFKNLSSEDAVVK